MSSQSHRKNVYFSDRTLAQLGDRDSLSGRVATIIDRYAELCRRERPWQKFEEAELSAIRDACLSWRAEPAATIFGGVLLEVEDALADGLGEKWGVDSDQILTKLRALSPGEEIALVDWLERKRATA
jgi:hypothetical protein